MKRLLWLGVGLAVGAIVVRKLTRRRSAFTPSGIASSLSAIRWRPGRVGA